MIEKEKASCFSDTKANPKYSKAKDGTVQIDVFYLIPHEFRVVVNENKALQFCLLPC